MKKRTLITTIALMAALSFAGCGKVNVSRIENGEITGSYTIPVEELTEYNSEDYYQEDAGSCTDDTVESYEYASDDDDYIYYQIDDRKRKPVLNDPSGYETGSSSSLSDSSAASTENSETYNPEATSDNYGEETSARINDNIQNVFGLTYPQIDGLTNYAGCSLYTMDALPSLYGVEYQNSVNGIYLMQKAGSENLGDYDTCIGAFGWLSRIIDFQHESPANVYSFADALRAVYPDCTGVWFTDKSVIPTAPSNISDELAYVEFTASFNNAPDTKVRLYVESQGDTCYVTDDSWVFLCPADLL